MGDIYRSSRLALQRFLLRFRSRPLGAALRGRRRGGVANTRVGRNTRPLPYRPGENLLAPLPTLLRALCRGRGPLPGEMDPPGEGGSPRRRLRPADLIGWGKRERENLTLILLVDVSRSSHYYLEVFRQILSSLAGRFRRQRDRMGLIVLQGRQAVILNHPTHNFRVIGKNLARLQIRGESPLADGLQKALAMARLERYRNPGSRSLVLLLSDCYPEPLTRLCEDLFDEPAYRDALSAARLFRRERINLLVINPSCVPAAARAQAGPGERLSEMLALRAGGQIIKVRPRSESARITREELGLVLTGIEAAFQAGRRPSEGRSILGDAFTAVR